VQEDAEGLQKRLGKHDLLDLHKLLRDIKASGDVQYYVCSSSLAVWGWKQEDLHAADIRLIHKAGLRAWSWTVDDIDRARELILWGLDGLITNVPGQMQRLTAR
jgi:glycerophosphoryl diester phosphodiesterase